MNLDTKKYDEGLYAYWYAPHTKWPVVSKNWCRLNDYYSFNRKKLLKEIQNIKTKPGLKPFPLTEKRKNPSLRGICLTAKENSQDPLYEGLKLFTKNQRILYGSELYKKNIKGIDPELYEKDFTKKTKFYKGYIADILNRFKSPLYKVRITELQKGGFLLPHVDCPYYRSIRVHSILQTNEKVSWTVGGEKFQIPSDGHWYWIDAGKFHSIRNEGQTSRFVLSLHLSIYENKNEIPTNSSYNFEHFITSKDL